MTEPDDLLSAIIEDQKKAAAAGGEPPAPPQPPTPPEPPTPPNPPPPPEPPKPPLPSDLLGEEYKEVESWDDIKGRLKKTADIEAEFEALKNKRPQYANETIAQYDNWVKNGGVDDFAVFSMIKGLKEDIDDVDALVTKEILENPELSKYSDLLRQRILDKYGVEATEDNGLTPEQVLFNKASLSKDAKTAKSFIKEQTAKMQVPASAVAQNDEEVIAKRKNDWSAATEQVLSKITEVNIPTVKKDGDKDVIDVAIKYQVPENVRKQYQERFVEIFSRVGDVTPETQKQMENEFKADFILNNLPYIISAALSHKEAELTELYDKKYAGYVLKDPGGSTQGSHGKAAGDESIERLLKD